MVDGAAAGEPRSTLGGKPREIGVNALAAGTRLFEFEIEAVLGEGGFGIVYLAFDHSLHRHVAVKEYLPNAYAYREHTETIRPRSEQYRATFEAGLKSFVQEARMLALFEHPALVKVHRFWEAHGTAYMAMSYYPGVTLRQWLKTDPNRATEASLKALIMPLLDAVELLHGKGCFHRDIAPDNIMVQPNGAPVLLDFGAARRVIGDMTQALTAVLKPGFAPVEQYAEDSGLAQGPWTDVYAFSATLYAAITGKAPAASIGRAFNDTVIPLHAEPSPGYDPAFLRGIDAGLAVRPADRPQTIASFREALGLTSSRDMQLQGQWAPRMTGPETIILPAGSTPQIDDGESTLRVPRVPAPRTGTSHPAAIPSPSAMAPATTMQPTAAMPKSAAEPTFGIAPPTASVAPIATVSPSATAPPTATVPPMAPLPPVPAAPPIPTVPSAAAVSPPATRPLSVPDADPALSPGKPKRWGVAVVGAALLLAAVWAFVRSGNGPSPDMPRKTAASAESPAAPIAPPPLPSAASEPRARELEPRIATAPIEPTATSASPTPPVAATASRVAPPAPPGAPAVASPARKDKTVAVESAAAVATPGKEMRVAPPPPLEVAKKSDAIGSGKPASVASTVVAPAPAHPVETVPAPSDRAKAPASAVPAPVTPPKDPRDTRVALAKPSEPPVPKSIAVPAPANPAATPVDAKAQFERGKDYETGRGVTKDPAEAAKWFRRAADRGFAPAQNSLGYALEMGRGVTQDDAEATRLYTLAAAQGDAAAENNLGRTYEQGRGNVRRNHVLAADWYRKSAEHGNSSAQRNLADMYENGRGVFRDDAEAFKWYSKAADQGSTLAQYHLGRMYESGRGVNKDPAEAAKWFRKAAAQGHAGASGRLAAMERPTAK